jgi:hypothetical protein
MPEPVAVPEALLPYILSCTPNPLYVSTSQDREVGQLTLEVGLPFSAPAVLDPIAADTGWDAGPGGTGGGVLAAGGAARVWCKWFEIVIPIGEEDTDLARIPDQSALGTVTVYAPGGWRSSARLFQPVPGAGQSWCAGVKFTAVDRSGVDAPFEFNGANPVNVMIGNIPVNAAPGFAVIGITEETSSTSGAAGFAERHAQRETPKAEKDFYFYDLHPTRPYVALGVAPMLQWKGNVANSAFTVYWWDGTGYQDAEVPGQSWQCPSGHIPQNTTTFMVAASHVPPNQSKAITVHLTTTVTVTNPNIEATSITAIGAITAGGDVTITGGKTLKTDRIAKASTAASAITIADNVSAAAVTGTAITATDKLSAGAGGVASTGAITATNITASGTITASGDITSSSILRANTIGRVSGSGVITINDGLSLLNGLTAASDVRVRGNLQADGRSSINVLSPSQMLYSGGARGFNRTWASVSSDGFMFVSLRTNAHWNSSWQLADMWHHVNVETSGSPTGHVSAPLCVANINAGGQPVVYPLWTVTVPVRKGQSVKVWVESATGLSNAADLAGVLWVEWIPLGAGAVAYADTVGVEEGAAATLLPAGTEGLKAPAYEPPQEGE